MLSCTHGEGFGRPLAEATCCDLPVIATGWSGQMDFLNPKQSTLIEGELKPVPKSLIWKPIIVEPSKWFCADEGDIIKKLINHVPGEHILINSDIDGTFPSHHPDPTEEKNLVEIKH